MLTFQAPMELSAPKAATVVIAKPTVASVYGLASMGSGFGGMLFTLITGWVVDHYSYTPAFIGFGIMPLVCALILWTMAGPLRSATSGEPALASS